MLVVPMLMDILSMVKDMLESSRIVNVLYTYLLEARSVNGDNIC